MTGSALEDIAGWPVPNAAAAVVRRSNVLTTSGPTDHVVRLASLTKTVTAWAALIAVEEGIVGLDDPVGPDDGSGRTLRHLLAHAGGYGFDTPEPLSPPERKRIYSNTGIEVAADHIAERAEMPFADYLTAGVLEPLGMTASELRGSPAHGLWSSVDDLVAFVGEVSDPRLVSEPTAALARRPHFPSLGGIVPGVGRYDNCPWGLGFEIRGSKSPHWTGSRNSAETFGHFGGAGTMMWIDPAADDLALIALTDRPFDEWSDEALELWPRLSNRVLEEYAGVG